MKMYVITTDGVPQYVCFSHECAKRIVDESDAHECFQVELVEGMRNWIASSMSRAAEARMASGMPAVVMPSREDAFWWAVSEVGEAAGAKVGSKGVWLRNNPDKHIDDDYNKECTQAVMMLILASTCPLNTIVAQLEKWGYDGNQD